MFQMSLMKKKNTQSRFTIMTLALSLLSVSVIHVSSTVLAADDEMLVLPGSTFTSNRDLVFDYQHEDERNEARALVLYRGSVAPYYTFDFKSVPNGDLFCMLRFETSVDRFSAYRIKAGKALTLQYYRAYDYEAQMEGSSKTLLLGCWRGGVNEKDHERVKLKPSVVTEALKGIMTIKFKDKPIIDIRHDSESDSKSREYDI